MCNLEEDDEEYTTLFIVSIMALVVFVIVAIQKGPNLFCGVLFIGIAALFAYDFYISRMTSDDHPILNQIRLNLMKINPKFGQIPLHVGRKSYTVYKSVITLCLKDPITDKYYPMNMLMYVALHELTHVVTYSQGHGPEFKNNFREVLKIAVEKGIYDPTIPILQSYCGVDYHAKNSH